MSCIRQIYPSASCMFEYGAKSMIAVGEKTMKLAKGLLPVFDAEDVALDMYNVGIFNTNSNLTLS